jgi:hypothetical protein
VSFLMDHGLDLHVIRQYDSACAVSASIVFGCVPTFQAFSMRLRLVLSSLLATGFAACSGTPPPAYQQERFDVTSAHSRTYLASPSVTCEAARRTLLSQGYLISAARPDIVEGRKSFQQDARTHVEVGFNVVCASTSKGGGSIAFVNALHDRYTLRKSAKSASLGVGALGTLSVPFDASDDAMVKVASETIAAPDFYDRFFGLLAHYLGPEGDPAAGREARVEK